VKKVTNLALVVLARRAWASSVDSRAHVLAWRKDLETRELGGATIRRKLAALSSLFEHLCDANAVTHNPVKGVKRPKVESYEGKTPMPAVVMPQVCEPH
jgi:site-specific recombinase XerC